MMSEYINLLTDEEKEAFRKGDAYYVSPFKRRLKGQEPLRDVCVYSTTVVYSTTNNTRIFEARMDRIISRQWN